MKKLLFIVAAAGVFAAMSSAQLMMGPGGGSPYMALLRKDVQKDLKLTDDQKTKVQAAQQDMGDSLKAAFQGLQGGGGGGDFETTIRTALKTAGDAFDKSVKAVLTPDQQKRTIQIYMQMNDANSLTNEDVQKLVGLTDDQTAKIKDLVTKMEAANLALGKQVRNQEIDFQTMRDDMKKNSDVMKNALEKIMTDAQKAKFKEVAGPKFEKDPNEQPGFFGGRRSGGGGGN